MYRPLLNPSLRRLHEEANVVAREFEELARDLSERQLHWRPEPEAWSIGQCLEHLVLSAHSYESLLGNALAKCQRAQRAIRPVRTGSVGRWLIAAAGSSAGGRRVSCPVGLVPTATPASGVLARFLDCQRRLASFIESADGLDVNGCRVRLPGSRVLRVRVGEAFQLATGHTRRHLQQARRVRLDPGFPA